MGDLATPHTHGADGVHQHGSSAALLGEARDVDGPGRGMQGRELLRSGGEQLAERRPGALVLGEVGLLRPRHARAEVVVAAEVLDADAGRAEQAAVPRRALRHPDERLAEPGEVGGGRGPSH